MLLLFILCLFASFSLSCTYNSLRTLREQETSLFLSNDRLFFYRPRFLSINKDNLFYPLFLSSLFAKSVYFVLTVASLTTLLFSNLPLNSLPGKLLSDHLLQLSVILLFTLITCELIPRIYASTNPQKALKITAISSSIALWLSLPLTYLFLRLPKAVLKAISVESLHGKSAKATENIRDMLENEDIQRVIGLQNKKLIGAVLKFKDRIAREVMIPRVDVFSLPASMSIKQAAQKLLEEGYSRVPVYKDSIDTILGILMYKDILSCFFKYQNQQSKEQNLELPIETLIKPAFYTPETRLVQHLLQEFRHKQTHLAIVVDEYGGTAGIITIEDILEEIVGDIADEYDEATTMPYTETGEGNWIIDAKMSILDIEENFNIKIPQDADYDTIGGYIYHKAGMIPQKGFCIYQDDFEIEVLSSSDRIIEKIRLSKSKHKG